MFAHTAGDVGHDDVVVIEFHPEHSVGESINDRAFHFDCVFFCHMFGLYP